MEMRTFLLRTWLFGGKARQCYPGSDGRKLMNQSYDEFGGRSALRWRLGAREVSDMAWMSRRWRRPAGNEWRHWQLPVNVGVLKHSFHPFMSMYVPLFSWWARAWELMRDGSEDGWRRLKLLFGSQKWCSIVDSCCSCSTRGSWNPTLHTHTHKAGTTHAGVHWTSLLACVALVVGRRLRIEPFVAVGDVWDAVVRSPAYVSMGMSTSIDQGKFGPPSIWDDTTAVQINMMFLMRIWH